MNLRDCIRLNLCLGEVASTTWLVGLVLTESFPFTSWIRLRVGRNRDFSLWKLVCSTDLNANDFVPTSFQNLSYYFTFITFSSPFFSFNFIFIPVTWRSPLVLSAELSNNIERVRANLLQLDVLS